LYWPLYSFMGCFIFDAVFFLVTLRYKGKVPMSHFLRNVARVTIHMIARIFVFYCMFCLPFRWFTFWKAVAFSTVPVGVFGTCFAVFTQLSHMTPEAYGNRLNNTKSWAAYQVLTTQNIAPESFLSFVLSGALNLQIEHHLFPTMCSEYFPHIAPLVRECCRRHNVPYQESRNYWEGFRRHRALLDICTETGFWV